MSPTTIPGIPYAAPPRAAAVASALAWPPRLVVIHDTSNTASAAAEANYAATRTDAQSNWTSAHAYIDTTGPLGSCPLNRQAWAAYSYANQHGIHLEMCGMNAGQPGAVPAATVARTAALVAQLCNLAGIPKVKLSPADVAAGKSGICGHYDITLGLGVGDHDDPGPAFNWAAFIAAVNDGGAMTNLGYSDDDGKYLCERERALMYLDKGKDGPENGTTFPVVDLLKRVDANAAKAAALAPVTLTDADRQAIADLVGAKVDAVGVKLDQVLARLTAAGDALDG